MKEYRLKITFELIWWLVTILALIVILYPIYNYTQQFPFYFQNGLYIIVFITLTRYIFFLKHTFFANWQKFKFLLIFLSIPGIFLLVQELHFFQTFLDERGEDALVGFLPSDYRLRMIKYIYNELLFFGVGSIIVAAVFPFRLIISIWRIHNGYND